MDCDKYIHTFSIIHRFCLNRHIKEIENCEVSGHQMRYIVYIHKHPGSSQEDIADFFKLNKGTVAKGIKKMLSDGYIIREQNETDRRAYKLFLSEKGESVFSESEKSMQQLNDILTRGMNCDEKALFIELLNRACTNALEAAGEERDELLRPPGPPPELPACCKTKGGYI